MWTDTSLKLFGHTIQNVMNGHDLTRQESYDMFRQILQNEQPDLQQGAFLAALKAKGETPPMKLPGPGRQSLKSIRIGLPWNSRLPS